MTEMIQATQGPHTFPKRNLDIQLSQVWAWSTTYFSAISPSRCFFNVVFQYWYHSPCYFILVANSGASKSTFKRVTVLRGIQSCIRSPFHSSNQAVVPLSFILTSSVEQMSQPRLLEIFEHDSCKCPKATRHAQNYN